MPADFRHPSTVAESERRLRFLDELAQATRLVGEPGDIMQATARLLGEHLGVNRCAYAQVEEDENHFDLIGDYNNGVPSIVGRYAFSDFGAEVLRLMRAGLPYVNPDVDTDPQTAGTDLAAYRLTRIQAVICVPLHKKGRFVAAMAVHQAVPRAWTPEEIALVREVVARCWESLDRIRGERVLAEAHQRLSLAMEAGDLGDWSWDAATDVIVLGGRAAAMYGLEAGKRLLRNEMRQVLHPDDRGEAEARARKSMEEHGVYSIEYRVIRPDGTQRWIAPRGKPTYAADGSLTGMIGIVQDVTHQHEMLESERAARQESERAGAIKDEFLATLSHELRTPLSAILGWAHILRRKLVPEQADLLKGVEVIERSTRMQTQLIDDLLDMSRITSGKMRLEVRPVSPVAFIQGAIDTMRPSADAGGVQIEAALDPDAGPVLGDTTRLQQVVWNLVANAVKFTPRGGVVQVGLERVDGHVRITVADTGVGIKPDFLPHIFDRFRQADGSITRRYGGLGLGLSIVRHLVELHGGTVEASSGGEGAGSTFVVQLPLAAQSAADKRDSARQAARAPSPFDTMDLHGIRVLVVDDEPDARDLLKRILEECGAVVLVADGATAALAMVEAQRPEVLVSDIGMPDVDGYELLRRVRQLGPGRGGALPAIALTAFARSEDRVRALRAGFAVHVSKPLEPSEIVASVASVAGRTEQ
ncbi:MAG: response regulator [Burkholderiales bacterium]|nr:response regulator [Burkholderiales bacterium]